MPDQGPPAFKILQILDSTTFVISGEGIGDLRIGEDLSVLAFGGEIPSTNARLVLIKAQLEVTSVVDAYAIARTPIEEKRESVSSIFGFNTGETRTVRVRSPLKVEAGEERGNPAKEAVKTGDIVIRTVNYRAYVDSQSYTNIPSRK